ncbi:MAG: hypothetical protein ACLFU8_07800 [Anaerolineales bacterium]
MNPRLALGALLALLVVALLPSGAAAQEEGPHRAGLVVVDAAGGVTTRCVPFDAPAVTGRELLEATDLTPLFSAESGGVLLCSLDGLGCPTAECFCECTGSPCRYWSYFHYTPEGWTYAGQGASARRLESGDVDGWVWGDGSQRPPEITFEELCPSATPTPAPPTGETPQPAPSPTAPAPTPAAGQGNGQGADYLWFALALLLLGAGYLLLGRRR